LGDDVASTLSCVPPTHRQGKNWSEHLVSGKMGDCMHGEACAFGREMLIEILEEAGGLMSASALCSKFYQQSEAARDHVREGHGSFKAFITKTALVRALDFVPDGVRNNRAIAKSVLGRLDPAPQGTDRIMCAQGCGSVALKTPRAAKAGTAKAVKQLDAREEAIKLLDARVKLLYARDKAAQESRVAGTLLDIVRQAPDEQISAAQLCSALYQKCASAKVVIHDYGGLKHFVASPVLKEAVEFHADEVLLSNMCLFCVECDRVSHLTAYFLSDTGLRDCDCYFTWQVEQLPHKNA